jgi:hypothetical protein
VFVYVCVFFCGSVQVEALRWANHPSKKSYRLSLIKKLRKLSPMLQKREQAPTYGSNEVEKKSSLSKIHFNIVNPPTSWSSQWSVSFWHSHQYPMHSSSSPFVLHALPIS